MNQVHSLPPNFFTIHFNIPSTTVFYKWSLSFRFHYQNLVCLSPHTCHMTHLSHPQMGDIRSAAIMLCAWVVTLLLGKVWASHSVAEDSGLAVCDAMSSGCSWYFKGSGSNFQAIHSTSSATLPLQEMADASLNVELPIIRYLKHISLQFSYAWIFATSFSLVGVIIMLWVGRSGVRIPTGATELFLFSILSKRVLVPS